MTQKRGAKRRQHLQTSEDVRRQMRELSVARKRRAEWLGSAKAPLKSHLWMQLELSQACPPLPLPPRFPVISRGPSLGYSCGVNDNAPRERLLALRSREGPASQTHGAPISLTEELSIFIYLKQKSPRALKNQRLAFLKSPPRFLHHHHHHHLHLQAAAAAAAVVVVVPIVEPKLLWERKWFRAGSCKLYKYLASNIRRGGKKKERKERKREGEGETKQTERLGEETKEV